MIGVQPIPTKRYEAADLYRQYRMALRTKQMTTGDKIVMMTARAISQGKAVIDVKVAIQNAGLDTRSRPRLAMARADWSRVRCEVWPRDGHVHFTDAIKGWNRTHKRYTYHDLKWNPSTERYVGGQAIVPVIPPTIRPARNLEKYSILFEAEWEAPPVDPYLLRHLGGSLYVVLAAWNLTPIERAVLGATR